MEKRTTKNSFSIKPINIEKVELTYNLSIQSNISKQPTDEPLRNSTRISELQVSIDPEFITYLDEAKKQRKCIPTMISHFNKKILPENTNMACFWCRHGFDSMPIGCPVRYVSSQIEKKYTSEITRDTYQIKENIDCEDIKNGQYQNSDKIQFMLHERNYYESDGIFCSFNCCLSFILENKRNPIYKNSKNLLFKIYRDISEMSPSSLIQAPSWRLLSVYGGHLSINDFRKCFNKVQYIEQNRILSQPRFAPMGFLFEEKNRF
jgi:hypothetical protein